MELTLTATKALHTIARLGGSKALPVKAVVFGQAMWPERTDRFIPANNPRRNLLAGGYLSRLCKAGLVEKVFYDYDPRKLRGYVLTDEGKQAIGSKS